MTAWRRPGALRGPGVATAAGLALALCGADARAQRNADSAQALPGMMVERRMERGPIVRCAGEVITDIEVRTYPPFVRGILKRWQLVAQVVSATHSTTRSDVIRNFLLLDAGQPCTEIARAESERILRAQPYLAAAIVRPVPNGPGKVRLIVETVDEITMQGGLDVRSVSPMLRMIALGEGNVMGQAIHASAAWRAGTYGRDGYSAKFVDYQAFRRPYILSLQGDRLQLGGRWEGAVERPYYTDLQRVAWRADVGGAHDFFRLAGAGGDDELALGSERTFASLGAIMRVGVPGRLSLFGASLTQEREDVDSRPVRITDEGPVPAPMSLLDVSPYRAKRSARVNALWGVRNLSFIPVHAFDALNAVQDVGVGFQGALRFGRSLAMLGSRDDDLFLATDLYAGFGGPSSFLTFNGKAEAREDYDTERWDGVLGSARLAWYAHAAPGQTLIASAEWSGGWHPRRPFQLLLGDREGGVRGYADSEVAGARRVVTRLESRWLLGQIAETGEYGVAVFADAGRTWAGEVPFGVDSPIKAGLGVSLLGAVPRESQRLWRVDLAFPVVRDEHARFELRVSGSNLGRRGWREPEDVRRSREQAVSDVVFRSP